MLTLWNYAKPGVKYAFWFISVMYLVGVIAVLITVGVDKGFEFVITRLGELWWPMLQFYLIWPVAPMLIIVLLSGLSRKLANEEELEA